MQINIWLFVSEHKSQNIFSFFLISVFLQTKTEQFGFCLEFDLFYLSPTLV